MPIAIRMPALSPTMEEGNLSKWFKKEGDKVYSGDVIASIETDKATMEVESVDSGILYKILVEEGTEDVLVNTLIAVLKEEGDDSQTLLKFIETESSKNISKIKDGDAPKLAPIMACSLENMPLVRERIFISPLAKRIAETNQLDIKDIDGSGPKGRIIKVDIERALEDRKSASKSKEEAVSSTSASIKTIPLSNMRKTIAKRLLESKKTIPHFYLTIEVSVQKLVEEREKIKEETKITINDFITKATACALIDVPKLNATFHEDHIKQYPNADIAIAVSIEDGLITPVVKNADLKSLKAISGEIKDLSKRAKDGALKPEDYQGGTFTISNLGMYGIKHFEAIINPPQVAILAVGGIKNNVMCLTLSVDHRAVDGSDAAEFLKKLASYLEDPMRMLVG